MRTRLAPALIVTLESPTTEIILLWAMVPFKISLLDTEIFLPPTRYWQYNSPFRKSPAKKTLSKRWQPWHSPKVQRDLWIWYDFFMKRLLGTTPMEQLLRCAAPVLYKCPVNEYPYARGA